MSPLSVFSRAKREKLAFFGRFQAKTYLKFPSRMGFNERIGGIDS
jgi:hypothetical protein